MIYRLFLNFSFGVPNSVPFLVKKLDKLTFRSEMHKVQ